MYELDPEVKQVLAACFSSDEIGFLENELKHCSSDSEANEVSAIVGDEFLRRCRVTPTRWPEALMAVGWFGLLAIASI